VILIN